MPTLHDIFGMAYCCGLATCRSPFRTRGEAFYPAEDPSRAWPRPGRWASKACPYLYDSYDIWNKLDIYHLSLVLSISISSFCFRPRSRRIPVWVSCSSFGPPQAVWRITGFPGCPRTEWMSTLSAAWRHDIRWFLLCLPLWLQSYKASKACSTKMKVSFATTSPCKRQATNGPKELNKVLHPCFKLWFSMFPNPIIDGMLVIFVMSDLACFCLTESYSVSQRCHSDALWARDFDQGWLGCQHPTTVGPLLICAWTLLLFNQKHYTKIR